MNKALTTANSIDSNGIKKLVNKYLTKEEYQYQVVAQYIWNGFDAKASEVSLEVEQLASTSNEVSRISAIVIRDNGDGIHADDLDSKFTPVHSSQKTPSNKHHSLPHGKDGIGRFSFFRLAKSAQWETTYKDNDGIYQLTINIQSHAIDKYVNQPPIRLTESLLTGTTVSLKEIDTNYDKYEENLREYLIREFGWFLHLDHKTLSVNNIPLDCSQGIKDSCNEEWIHEETQTKFQVKYIQWKQQCNKEESQVYYLDSNGQEKWKHHTTLNRNADTFFHSIYVTSPYFDQFKFNSMDSQDQNEDLLSKGKAKDPEYKFLHNKIQAFLKLKRKPYVKEKAKQLVQDLENQNIFPKPKNEWEKPKYDSLKKLTGELYTIEPKIFKNLNNTQKQVLIRTFDLLLDTRERENIYKILENIVELDSDQRTELRHTLEYTSLDRIIQTIKLIEDRYKTVEYLKELVFNKSLNANEVDHVQKCIEKHFWLFGEQYHLVAHEEDDFQKALEKYKHILRTNDWDMDEEGFESTIIDHPDKNKEMDIFICKSNKTSKGIEHIVLELKHPQKSIGKKAFDQVFTYLRTIINTPQFNGSNRTWAFHLIGRKFTQHKNDPKPHIKSLRDQFKSHGEFGLINFDHELNYKIYARTWDEIFTEFECKHEFLQEKLKLNRALLLNNIQNSIETPDQIVRTVNNLTSAILSQHNVSPKPSQPA